MLHTSVTADSGIDTGSITNLPSGIVGKEENVNGEALFSIEEGLAKVYFPSTTPEEVFYNPGKFILVRVTCPKMTKLRISLVFHNII